jgi:hypothetical protein
MISRGRGYDTVLRWKPAAPRESVAGYAVVIRSTLSPYWEREIPVGDVTEYTLADVSMDVLKFGVRAIGANGYKGLVSPYLFPARRKREVETIP